MTTRATVLVSLLLAIGLVGIHQASKEMPDSSMINRFSKKARRHLRWRGKYAPDFELGLINGGTFRLADAAGNKIVILNFFATWCRPCKSEMPELSKFALNHRNDPVVLLGISGDDDEGQVSEFVGAQKVAFPVGVDSGGAIRRKYGVDSYPTTLLIDPKGKIALYETGAISNADVFFEHMLSPLLSDIRRGEGIGREEYIAGQRHETYLGLLTQGGTQLHGRAAEIAEKIYCPCGRGRRLAMCSCPVATRMKKDLVQAVQEEKDDKMVIQELSRKYSVVKE
ncbi:MAG: redoxin domain-containing protein [Candidatus Aureabacteria bacterium]|nr:redoxin domain-containing protein [Candidatus Auribacterota bacterium]